MSSSITDDASVRRREEMVRALRWSGLLLLGFCAITLDVVNNGALARLDRHIEIGRAHV